MNILEQSYQVPSASNMIHAKKWHTDAADHALAPIILMHDSLGCVALWRDFPAQLAQATARVVYAYDRLGFGFLIRVRSHWHIVSSSLKQSRPLKLYWIIFRFRTLSS